jgi:hypothetical protein
VEYVSASPGRPERPAQGPDAFREHERTGYDDAWLLGQMAMRSRCIEANHFDFDLPPEILKQLECLERDASAFA